MFPGLDVAVVDARLMGDAQCTGGFGCDLGCAPGEQRPFGPPDVPQRPARDELHHHVVGVAVLTEVVDADDVGVHEVRRRLGFALEAGNECVVSGELRVEDLDRDFPSKADVLSLEDIGHTAAGEMAGDAIASREDTGVSHGMRWYRWPGFFTAFRLFTTFRFFTTLTWSNRPSGSRLRSGRQRGRRWRHRRHRHLIRSGRRSRFDAPTRRDPQARSR